MVLWQRALLGSLLIVCLQLRTPLALHLHGDSSGEAESQGEPFSQLRAALASLSAHGTSAADWRAALRRAANSADNGLPESEEESSPDSASSRREVQRLSSMSQEDFIRETTVMLQKEVEMLSSSQRETLRAIQNGSVGKDQVEIVLAHYNEHVGWSAMYDSLITPYCKGAPEDYPWRPRYCKELPNKGREAHTFLHHIVQNYHMLADWTVFSQAQAPTSGMAEEGDHRNGHIYPGATFHDYVLGGGPFSGDGGDSRGARFVFNGQWKPQYDVKKNYKCDKLACGPTYDLIRMSFAANYFVALGLDEGPPQRLNKTCLRLKGKEGVLWFAHDRDHHAWHNALRTYIQALGATEEKRFYYSQGARFALSRERIRQRPREFYEQLLRTVDSDVDPTAGVFAELLWYYIPGRAGGAEQPCEESPFAGCPEGFEQLGSLADHAPYGRVETLRTSSIEECAAACRSAIVGCGSFEYHAKKPKLCVLQARNNSVEEAQLGFWPGAVACRRAGRQFGWQA